MRSVRGGVLLAVLLVARAQASDTWPHGAWGSIMEVESITLYSCRFPPHHWILLFPDILKPEARSALRNTSIPPWDPVLERWVEGTLQFHLKPLLTLLSTAAPAPTWAWNHNKSLAVIWGLLIYRENFYWKTWPRDSFSCLGTLWCLETMLLKATY